MLAVCSLVSSMEQNLSSYLILQKKSGHACDVRLLLHACNVDKRPSCRRHQRAPPRSPLVLCHHRAARKTSLFAARHLRNRRELYLIPCAALGVGVGDASAHQQVCAAPTLIDKQTTNTTVHRQQSILLISPSGFSAHSQDCKQGAARPPGLSPRRATSASGSTNDRGRRHPKLGQNGQEET